MGRLPTAPRGTHHDGSSKGVPRAAAEPLGAGSEELDRPQNL